MFKALFVMYYIESYLTIFSYNLTIHKLRLLNNSNINISKKKSLIFKRKAVIISFVIKKGFLKTYAFLLIRELYESILIFNLEGGI
jgi:hypothetical protein